MRRKAAVLVALLAVGLVLSAGQEQAVAAGWPEPQEGEDTPAQQAGAVAATEKPDGGKAGDAAESSDGAAVSQSGAGVGSAAAGSEAEVEEVKTEEQLAKAVESAAKGTTLIKRIVSAIVRKEAPAELSNNGLGDISPTGACQAEIQRYCKKKKPGAKRLADCLWEKLEEEEEEEDNDHDLKFSPECRSELDSFEQDAASNINKNVPLALACKEDIEKHCEQVDTSAPGALLGCLRENRSKLKHDCKKQVFLDLLMSAQDLRLDLGAWKRCSDDAKKLCADVKPHRGRIQACLRDQTGSLSWECKEQLFRRDMETSDDIRLSISLMTKCMADKKRFCDDVEAGHARVKDCLEDHIMEQDMSEECTHELANMISARSLNFRLDSKIREYCAEDVEFICGISQNLVLREKLNDAMVEESIQKCLQDHRNELRNDACADRVKRMISLSMSDIRFNHPLAEACATDRATHCAGIPPGSARVIRCLEDKRSELSEPCAAMLFDQEQVMAENIDFQFPLKTACSTEIRKYCGGVRHGGGRVVRCLQLNLEQEKAFGSDCKKELRRQENNAAQDYRLNSRLKNACEKTVKTICSQACGNLDRKAACGGTVLQCLTENYESIEDEDCRSEVFYFMKMEVRDYSNDVFLATACRGDVERYCQEHIATGQGRVVQCLHDNRDRLSAECRREEIKLDVMQSSNIELRPRISKACRDERKQLCADVRPGKGRVLDCLVAKADKVDFSEQCREVLGPMQAERLLDYRRDYGMRKACEEDAKQVCAGEDEDKQDGAVFRCLLSGVDGLSPGCREAVGHAASASLRFYTLGMPGAEACDEDVKRYCTMGGEVPQGVGHVRGCLLASLEFDRAVLSNRTLPAVLPVAMQAKEGPGSGTPGRKLGEVARGRRRRQRTTRLSEACRAFLDVAAPEDGWEELEAGLATSAVLSQLDGVEKALGLEEGTLLSDGGSGGKGLTLTGWVALLAMFGLATATLGAGVFLARRFWGPTRGYTMVVKHEPHPERSPMR